MEDLKDAIEKAWSIYGEFKNEKNEKNETYVIGHMPILFFGNKEEYDISKIKIITVGLNPSWREFKENRFPKSEGINYEDIKDEWKSYLKSLNRYFYQVKAKALEKKPYERWFNNFELVLEGLDCSFYDGKENTALHTDFCTPLATKPTWSNPKEESSDEERNEFKNLKNRLKACGNELWIKLVEILKPKIIIISISKKYLKSLKKIGFIESADLNEWYTVCTITKKKDGSQRRPYVVRSTKSKYGNTIIFGEASRTPFAVSNEQKIEIGKEIKRILEL